MQSYCLKSCVYGNIQEHITMGFRWMCLCTDSPKIWYLLNCNVLSLLCSLFGVHFMPKFAYFGCNVSPNRTFESIGIHTESSLWSTNYLCQCIDNKRFRTFWFQRTVTSLLSSSGIEQITTEKSLSYSHILGFTMFTHCHSIQVLFVKKTRLLL